MGIGTDRDIAVHEAGHAIVARARGLDVSEARIGPPGQRHVGAKVLGPHHVPVRTPRQPDDEELERYSNEARHIYGGFVAERKHNPEADQQSAVQDFANADQISREIFEDDDPRRSRWMNDQFVGAHDDVDENWAAIEALADALLEHQVLDGQEVQEIYYAYKPAAD